MKTTVFGSSGSGLLVRKLGAGAKPGREIYCRHAGVQADGRYEADPDLATLSFSVFARIRISSRRATRHHNPCRRLPRSLKRMA